MARVTSIRKAEHGDTDFGDKLVSFVELGRFNKPAGKIIPLWPFLWSMVLASDQTLPPLTDLSVVAAFVIVVSAAGCAINDISDLNLDKKVERCKTRPLATGKLGVIEATLFAIFMVSVAAALLHGFHVNALSWVLCIPLLMLLCIYPLMKRITYWAQFVLGITINWGVFLGWSFVRENLDFSILLPLYIGGVSWTIIYDTIYAHQDKVDDSKLGLKSTALLFGNSTKTWLTFFNIVIFVGLTVAGQNASAGWGYFFIVALANILLSYQIITVNLNNPKDCMNKFIANQFVGGIIFVGTLLI